MVDLAAFHSATQHHKTGLALSGGGLRASLFHIGVLGRLAELDLLPAVRKASKDVLVVADGTSCRHQIGDNTDRKPIHVARLLEMALKDQEE